MNTFKRLFSIIIILASLFSFSCKGTTIIKSTTNITINPKKIYVIVKEYSYYTPSDIIFIHFQPGHACNETYNIKNIYGDIIYTIKKRNAIGDTSKHIVKYLKENGFDVTYGSNTYIPQNIDLLIEYCDFWQWDFKDYLRYLHISFIDPKTSKQYISAEYISNQNGFHDHPTSEREVPIIMNNILKSYFSKRMH